MPNCCDVSFEAGCSKSRAAALATPTPAISSPQVRRARQSLRCPRLVVLLTPIGDEAIRVSPAVRRFPYARASAQLQLRQPARLARPERWAAAVGAIGRADRERLLAGQG